MILKKLLIHQALFLQAPYVYPLIRFIFLIGGYACGKTSSLQDSILYAINYFNGKKDKEGKNPKIMIGGISLTFLRKTLTGGIEQVLKNTKSEYNFDKAHNIIYVANVELLLIPIQNEEDIFGYDCCCGFIDELDELPTYESMAVVKACNDRCRQIIPGCRPPFLSFATTSQGLKGTYQTCMEFEKAGMPFMIIRGRTKDNIYLPKEYVSSMYKIYNEKERECLLEGKFVSIDSGLVFPDYDPEKNKLDVDFYDYVRKNGDTVYIGQDFNEFGNYAQAYIILDGAIIMVKDYKLPDVSRAPEYFRYDFPESKILWIPDMTSKNHFPEYRKELKKNDIKVVYRSVNPMVKDRDFACNKLFKAEKLFLCPMCTMSDTALMTHQKDPKTGQPMKGGDGAPDHLNDCMGYAVHYMLSWCRELKNLYQVTLGYIYSKREKQGASDEEKEHGYRIMNADQLKNVPKVKKQPKIDK